MPFKSGNADFTEPTPQEDAVLGNTTRCIQPGLAVQGGVVEGFHARLVIFFGMIYGAQPLPAPEMSSVSSPD